MDGLVKLRQKTTLFRPLKSLNKKCNGYRIQPPEIILDKELYDSTKNDTVSYAAVYGHFMYKAGSWTEERLVVCKIEKPANSMEHRFMFIVTNTNSSDK